jgi:hypothetical protein
MHISDEKNCKVILSRVARGFRLRPKCQFVYILEDLGMENVGIFDGHLVYFMAVWYNYWSFNYFMAVWYSFWSFGIFFSFLVSLDPEKSGNSEAQLVVWPRMKKRFLD